MVEPATFVKKPVAVKAMQFDGTKENARDILEWMVGEARSSMDYSRTYDLETDEFGVPIIRIYTLEGSLAAYPEDWIIQGVKGEFYPCKPDIFEQTYTRELQGEPHCPNCE